MMNFIVYLVISVMSCSVVFAQNEDSVIDNWPEVKYAGKMLQLRWEPAGKSVKVFVTGYEAAAVKFTDVAIEASYGIGENKKFLTVDRRKDHFLVDNKTKLNKMKLKLKVRDDDLGSYNLNMKKN